MSGTAWQNLLASIRVRLTARPLTGFHLSGPSVVLASAPNPVLPPDFDTDWTLITVNASQAILSSLGIDRIPDLTVMSGQMLGKKPANLAGQEAIKGRRTRHLLLIERGDLDRTECEDMLDRLEFGRDRMTIISAADRSKITFDVLGALLSAGSGAAKISTGMFTALVAYYLGSKPVLLSGMSLNQTGHAYDDRGLPRAHVDFDVKALGLIHRKHLSIFATDEHLSSRGNLQLWPSLDQDKLGMK